ncbi:MAG: hypothetical protein IJS04_02155 [Muribaculaceae bacterium]|nr:hypothetical protein [Muribaculaceae bacterium]
MERQPITPLLRSLPVGGFVTYPIDRANTIRKMIWTNLDKERAQGMRFKTEKSKDGQTITVTRTA